MTIENEEDYKRLSDEVFKAHDEAFDRIEAETDWEQERKEIIEKEEKENKSIRMYDWATKKDSNKHAMIEKYGSEIVNQILEYEREGVHIPSTLISDLHRINEGKKPYKHKKKIPPPEKSIKRKPIKYPERDPDKVYTPTKFDNKRRYAHVTSGIYNMVRRKKILKNPTTLLIYLIQEKAWEGKKDKHKTWDHWYIKKNLIVASRSVDQMAADLGVHRGTIMRWSESLERDGLIEKKREGFETVYILGKIVNNKELYYYCGDIEPVKGTQD